MTTIADRAGTAAPEHRETREREPDARRSRAERVALGKDARKLTPLSSQGEFDPARSRDPVGLLLDQARTRVPELVPIRHGRMLASPFTYFRGAALPMAADLARTPVSGLRVQLCGDAHLANFGAFASPERRLVFDINDFDETLPGPFEWDVKRLAASLAVAALTNGYRTKARHRIVTAAAAGYRTAMREFAGQSLLQVWYARLDVDDVIARFRSQIAPKRFTAVQALLAGARTRDSRQALGKLTRVEDGRHRIVSRPPTIVPVEEVFSDVHADEIYELIRGVVGRYKRSLQSDRRRLLDQFDLVQVARKVVGVGSVGQRAWIVLLEADGGEVPLFLQAKQAERSVLADYCGGGRYANQGERVVAGQHLMQAQSDIFLGWTHSRTPDGADRDFYVRQLRDWKFSAPIERMRSDGMALYARMCGWTLARAHARSGDRIAIAAYLGGSDKFDRAIVEFSERYAAQNERDHAAFDDAVRTGRVEAVRGV